MLSFWVNRCGAGAGCTGTGWRWSRGGLRKPAGMPVEGLPQDHSSHRSRHTVVPTQWAPQANHTPGVKVA